MKVTLSKTFKFDAAHYLPCVEDTHKCKNLHGHSWKVEIQVHGEVDKEKGWFMDFKDLKDAWNPVKNLLDHHVLNEIEGLENPTSEMLAVWIWDKISYKLPGLHSIIIYETDTSKCIYMGD